ncbi:phosphatase [Streptomyces sp. Ru71]|nr:phosphatase [Streptomyces sp. Ru71]
MAQSEALGTSTPMLRLVALCGLPEEFTTPWQRLPMTAPVPVADAIRDNRLVWVGSQGDMVRHYPRAAAVLPYPFALAALPLYGAHRCWGGIVLMWPADHPRHSTARERARIVSGARRLAQLLDDAPTEPSLPERPRSVPVDAAHHPLQTGLAAADYLERLPWGALSLDLEGRITFISRTASRLLGRGADRLLGTRPWESLPWLDDPVHEDHYRTAVVSRAPVYFTAVRPPGEALAFELYPDASGISVRVIPRSGPLPDGAPAAPARRPGIAPTGRLYQLVHLAAALGETVGVQDLVALVAGQILPAFGAQGLVLSAADAGRLKITGHHGYPREAIERLDALPLSTELTPAGQVLASGAPAFFASPAELAARFPRAPRISGKQAWAFLPLIVTGRPVGCCILSYDEPHAFTADERAVLTSLAGLIAQALDRARLYDAKQQLVQELQRALLPRTLPTLPGLAVAARYLPAGHGVEIGGDFYDVLRLDSRTAAAVIGDVEGHSVAAAALMGQVRTAIHAHATSGASPDEVLACTNRLLTELDSELLVSCLYVHLDLDRHLITLASAGHVAPLLRTGPGRARTVEAEPGPLLGIDTRARYPTTSLPLPPGAVLTLYTDGLVEVPGADASEVTADLVAHLAGADHRDLEGLIDGLVGRIWPTARYSDDITVLALRAGPVGP